MHHIKAISPSLVIHYLKIDPNDRGDVEILDRLIDKKWEINKSEDPRNHIPIKVLYEKLL
jgi:hypothetical protein